LISRVQEDRAREITYFCICCDCWRGFKVVTGVREMVVRDDQEEEEEGIVVEPWELAYFLPRARKRRRLFLQGGFPRKSQQNTNDAIG
jgi:hypothetical protein